MKTKYWLIGLLGITITSFATAKNELRIPIKCYVQIEDNSNIVHQFVSNEKNSKQFASQLIGKPVFMVDGKTEQTIITVYECVDNKSNFKNKEAIKLERNTPF
ncbi:hypothetical protein CW745_11325 [Psychromonas sp. psych-6C06]|uniref:TapY2 family type IVa secretion system protein n=1 Tax=Psychromonas sp. psych-6C06 TaxID=2058089 RepID=UPI000C33B647|nr:TapY2 family type IVa secretion system protein [Psychromonas sp. psych-6C06]PKF61217.1 hypothetical protein CW745_11325 [Psychromonas sp. psych-6C06]